MTICWYCSVNAWPAEVVDAYEETLNLYPEYKDDAEQTLHHGLGHAVWADENFDDVAINASREYAMSQMSKDPTLTARELYIALMSFEFLQRIPEAVRVPYADEDELMEYFKLHDAPPPAKGPMKPIPQG